MLNKIIVLCAGLTLAMGFVSFAAAEAEVLEPATLVIYRAGEAINTDRIDLDVHVDDSSVARLEGGEVMVVKGAPGSYTLGSSISGTSPLVIELQPGQVHYVHTQLRMLGNRVAVAMVEVGEQTAKIASPELEPLI